MKRFFVIFFVLLTCLPLCACSAGGSADISDETASADNKASGEQEKITEEKPEKETKEPVKPQLKFYTECSFLPMVESLGGKLSFAGRNSKQRDNKIVLVEYVYFATQGSEKEYADYLALLDEKQVKYQKASETEVTILQDDVKAKH